MEDQRLDPESPEVIHAMIMNILGHWPPKVTVTRKQYETILLMFPEDADSIRNAISSHILEIAP